MSDQGREREPDPIEPLEDVLGGRRRDPELEGFLDVVRGACEREGAGWSAAREGRLVARVLARTTREDLSWRGELRLLAGFVRERLAASRVLRVVAASLVLHLGAMPVLAWYLVREAPRTPTFVTGIEPPLEPAFADPVEERLAPEVADREAADPPAPPPGVDEGRLRRARYVLSTRRGPRLEEAPEDSLERKWWTRRTRFLSDGTWDPAWDAEARATWSTAGLLARILWAELALDRVVLADTRPPQLAHRLHSLEPDAAPDRPLEPAERALAEDVLDRARAYGVLPWPAGFTPERVSDPLEARWAAELRAADRHGRLGAPDDLQALGLWTGS